MRAATDERNWRLRLATICPPHVSELRGGSTGHRGGIGNCPFVSDFVREIEQVLFRDLCFRVIKMADIYAVYIASHTMSITNQRLQKVMAGDVGT